MNNYICLDSSVLVKILTWEDGSEKAVKLFDEIVKRGQKIVLPDFAWAEIGTVLRKKVRMNKLKADQADELWKAFRDLGIIHYVESSGIMDVAWEISSEDKLPTLYDSAYIAVSKIYSNEDNTCEFWTADERLINSVSNNKSFIRRL